MARALLFLILWNSAGLFERSSSTDGDDEARYSDFLRDECLCFCLCYLTLSRFLSFFFTLLYLELCGRFSDLYMDVEDEARRTYLGMVTAMDYAVGEVVTALKEANMLVG